MNDGCAVQPSDMILHGPIYVLRHILRAVCNTVCLKYSFVAAARHHCRRSSQIPHEFLSHSHRSICTIFMIISISSHSSCFFYMLLSQCWLSFFGWIRIHFYFYYYYYDCNHEYNEMEMKICSVRVPFWTWGEKRQAFAISYISDVHATSPGYHQSMRYWIFRHRYEIGCRILPVLHLTSLSQVL